MAYYAFRKIETANVQTRIVKVASGSNNLVVQDDLTVYSPIEDQFMFKQTFMSGNEIYQLDVLGSPEQFFEASIKAGAAPVSLQYDLTRAQAFKTDAEKNTNIRSAEAEVMQTTRINSDRTVFSGDSITGFTSPYFGESNFVGTLNPFTLTATKSPGLEPNEAVDAFFNRNDLFITTTRQTGTLGSSPLLTGNQTGLGIAAIALVAALALSK